MYQHIIAIGSSYRLGKRIAWHYADEEISRDVLEEFSTKTRKILGRPVYSIHKLSTDSKEWDSIVEKDSFFDGYQVYEKIDDFLLELLKDKEITALDIAKLLLSIQPMSNLKLQKMIYLVYADYLMQTQKKLFEDKIIAYQFGPVVEEVYRYYKEHGREKIQVDDDQQIELKEITMPMTLAKILQSDDEKQVLLSVRKTIQRFGDKSASELVSITHRKGSPWDRVSRQRNSEITDELILKYHSVELT